MKRQYVTAMASFVAGAACAMLLMRAYGQQGAAAAPAGTDVATASTLPPSEVGQGNGPASQARLKNSPRHGEWVEVKVAGSDKPLKVWVVYPERADKAPVVLTVMEIFGMTDWVRATADQLAADGFIAMAPDFLSLKAAGAGVNTLSKDEIVADLNAVRAYGMKNVAASNGKTGIVGFCWGGNQVFNYAVAQPALDVAVAFYGMPPLSGRAPDAEAVAKIKAPLAGFFGGNDNRVTSVVAPTKALMDKNKQVYETHIFAGAGHGFMRQQTGANGTAAKEAWPLAVAFLKEHLEAKPQ